MTGKKVFTFISLLCIKHLSNKVQEESLLKCCNNRSKEIDPKSLLVFQIKKSHIEFKIFCKIFHRLCMKQGVEEVTTASQSMSARSTSTQSTMKTTTPPMTTSQRTMSPTMSPFWIVKQGGWEKAMLTGPHPPFFPLLSHPHPLLPFSWELLEEPQYITLLQTLSHLVTCKNWTL